MASSPWGESVIQEVQNDKMMALKTMDAERLRYYDISPTVSERSAVFPGDTPFRRSLDMCFFQGHHLCLSHVETTLHIGAHADAPSHYRPEGETIDARPLELYLGPCQVLAAGAAAGARILPEGLGAEITAPRLLLKTGSFPDPDCWREDFNSLSPELVDFAAARGVRLIGIDTPSIDPHDSKALESHQAAFRHDMAVLEGLVLDHVPEGRYELIALPLKLKGSDASPVRAILVQK